MDPTNRLLCVLCVKNRRTPMAQQLWSTCGTWTLRSWLLRSRLKVKVAFGNTFKTFTTNLLISARPYQPLPLLEGTLSVDTRWNNQPREHFESIPFTCKKVLSFNKLSNPRRRLGTAGKAATFCYRVATSLSLTPSSLRFPHGRNWIIRRKPDS